MYIQCIHVWINAYLAATVPVTTRLLQPSIHSVFFCHLRPGYGLVPIEDQNVPRQQIIVPCCLGNNVTRTFFRSIHGTLMASWYTILYGSKPADVYRISALNSIQKLFQWIIACFFLPLMHNPFFWRVHVVKLAHACFVIYNKYQLHAVDCAQVGVNSWLRGEGPPPDPPLTGAVWKEWAKLHRIRPICRLVATWEYVIQIWTPSGSTSPQCGKRHQASQRSVAVMMPNSFQRAVWWGKGWRPSRRMAM